jgi:putative peptidoglycan lipid II flippase
VIGIAVGTVLLPEMSRRIAAGDVARAHAAQNRAVALTVALTAPFTVAFLVMPDLVMSALFRRGAFDAAAAERAGAVLAAYGVGLPAIVLISSARATFYARADTTTPMIAAFTGVGVNVALKIALTRPFGVGGLALATAIGTWVNLGLLFWLAYRRDWTAPDRVLGRALTAVAAATLVLTAYALAAPLFLAPLTAQTGPWRDLALLALVGSGGATCYAAALVALLRALGVRLPRA